MMHVPRSPLAGKNHCYQPLCCWFCCDCCFLFFVVMPQNNVHLLRASKAPSLSATLNTKRGKGQSRDNRAMRATSEVLTEHKY